MAVTQKFSEFVASKEKVALSLLVLAVWVPCCRQANWSIAVYCSSRYLGLNLLLQMFCMVYRGKACLHKAERWQCANRSLSIAGVKWVTRNAVNFSRHSGFSRSFQCIILLRAMWENVTEILHSSYKRKMGFWCSNWTSWNIRFPEEFVLCQCNSAMNTVTVRK